MSEFDEVRAHVLAAIELLRSNDEYLLRKKAYEVTVAHKLATYMQTEFPCWHVDIEYDLDFHDTKDSRKRLRNIVTLLRAKRIKPRRVSELVRPDVIVHRREQDDNLLVVEVKKAGNSAIGLDDCKLREFTGSFFLYRFGLLLRFQGAKQEYSELTWYEAGEVFHCEKL